MEYCPNNKEVVVKTYSMDFRCAVARVYDKCGSSREVAEQFGCSQSWVRRLIQRRRASGSVEPRPHGRPNNNKLDARDEAQLRQLIAQTPDMTLGELAAALDTKVSVPTVWRATQRLKLPLKKSPSMPPNRIARTSGKDGTSGSSSSGT
jgi:transposase